MKNNINDLFAPLSENSLKSLTAEVKETVANVTVKSNFKAVDLWKIQSTRKLATRSRQAIGA